MQVRHTLYSSNKMASTRVISKLLTPFDEEEVELLFGTSPSSKKVHSVNGGERKVGQLAVAP